MNRVAFVKTADRSRGVKASIAGLGINPVKGMDVLIKPNFNTADPCPGSTHNDTLVSLVDSRRTGLRTDSPWKQSRLASKPGNPHMPAYSPPQRDQRPSCKTRPIK